jgi:hypothetical protein
MFAVLSCKRLRSSCRIFFSFADIRLPIVLRPTMKYPSCDSSQATTESNGHPGYDPHIQASAAGGTMMVDDGQG